VVLLSILIIPFLIISDKSSRISNAKQVGFFKTNKTDDIIVLENHGFKVFYSKSKKCPNYIVATLTAKGVKNRLKRISYFKTDKRIDRKYQQTNRMYRAKPHIYDKGHLFPNALADEDKMTQKDSFLLSNVAPQHYKLNRYSWKTLERLVSQTIIKNGKGSVITGCYGSLGKLNTINIPERFFKILITNGTITCWDMSNDDKTKSFLVKSKRYKVDVDYLYDKYPELEDIVQTLL